jgi:2-C-methyl-D-erythritol 2,4-cyclodiphosphate synthase
MKKNFFRKKSFFDFHNDGKLIICDQKLDFFPLVNQNCDQLQYVILMAILNCFYRDLIINDLKSMLIKIEKNNQSIDLILSEILNFICRKGYKIGNLTIHMSLQKPKLCQKNINYKIRIQDNLCNLLNLKNDQIVVQAGTGEKIGDVGNCKVVIFIVNVSLVKKDDKINELVGFGYDRHRFFNQAKVEIEKKLIICGQKIDYCKNIDAHSDGDIVFHAIANAIFSAIGEGDIGDHFPDVDAKWKNAKSIQFIEYTLDMMKNKSLRVKSIKVEIVSSLKFQNVLKKVNFLQKAQEDLMKILNIRRKKECYIKLSLASKKKLNCDERCIKNDEGIEANVKMILI